MPMHTIDYYKSFLLTTEKYYKHINDTEPFSLQDTLMLAEIMAENRLYKLVSSDVPPICVFPGSDRTNEECEYEKDAYRIMITEKKL